MSVESLACLVGPVIALLKAFGKVKCPHMAGVVIPRYAGKTTFTQSITSNDYLILDLEENVKMMMSENEKAQLLSLQGSPSFNLHYYPLCLKYLDEIRANHKGKSIIVFLSSLELAQYCKIKTLHTYIPCSKLCDEIKARLGQDAQKVFETCKNDLLVKLKPKQLNVYSSFEQLTDFLCAKFKLVSKL
jgi:hypothetical protein